MPTYEGLPNPKTIFTDSMFICFLVHACTVLRLSVRILAAFKDIFSLAIL